MIAYSWWLTSGTFLLNFIGAERLIFRQRLVALAARRRARDDRAVLFAAFGGARLVVFGGSEAHLRNEPEATRLPEWLRAIWQVSRSRLSRFRLSNDSSARWRGRPRCHAIREAFPARRHYNRARSWTWRACSATCSRWLTDGRLILLQKLGTFCQPENAWRARDVRCSLSSENIVCRGPQGIYNCSSRRFSSVRNYLLFQLKTVSSGNSAIWQ